MATYREELAPDIVLENMTAYRRYVDDTVSAIRVYANEGYVIYDTADENYELDPDTMEEIPVTYYFTMVTVPASQFSVDTFTWVAVPRSDVDENYIFGVGNDHVTA